MSDMNVQQVLAQMRVMEAQAKSQIGPDALSINEVQGAQKTDFSEVLANSINSVNDTVMKSGDMAKAFEKGDSGITMAELMINMEKASVSFQAMTSVRNKLLTAYQEIMNMPV
ncbi:MAG: flagellar hook-basal body complex protein FliE [endosymbiont of Galathealinum brachiosum]|uniref:Flagellar hook-basal body complex protein FliE n=1 Tax=endosymbiont of Galathealinum brachiosum TaxID=2200906 RepID=A0A370DJY7_9GAMM|nr:MAG: flagellar hook-basal body complex protein FliE [endosymbiont of Galathealinum brachiosum]